MSLQGFYGILAGSLRDPYGILTGPLRDPYGILAGSLTGSLTGSLRAHSFQLFPQATPQKVLVRHQNSFPSQLFHNFFTFFPGFFPRGILSNSFPSSHRGPPAPRKRSRKDSTRIPQGFRKDAPRRRIRVSLKSLTGNIAFSCFFLRGLLRVHSFPLRGFAPLKFSWGFPCPTRDGLHPAVRFGSVFTLAINSAVRFSAVRFSAVWSLDS